MHIFSYILSIRYTIFFVANKRKGNPRYPGYVGNGIKNDDKYQCRLPML